LFYKQKFYELIGICLDQKPLISVKRPETVEIHDNNIKYVVLDCSPLNFIDSVGVKLLIEVCEIDEAYKDE
jgi:anti-anti-sigma regulatory factor